jgi:hypothetical protein
VTGTTAVYRMDRSTLVPTYAESGFSSQYSLAIQCTTADASVAAGDLVILRHLITGYDYQAIANGSPFTIQFWARSVKAGTYCLEIRNDANNRCFIKEYTLAANTFKKITVSFNSDTVGTWEFAGSVGLSVCWTLMAGSTFQSTANSWLSGNFRGTANQVNFSDSTSNIFYLSQFMVLIGQYASDSDLIFSRAGKTILGESSLIEVPSFRADKNGVNGSYNGSGVTQTVDWVIGSSFSFDQVNGFSANGYTIPCDGKWFFHTNMLVNMASGSMNSIQIRNHNTGDVYGITYLKNSSGSAEDLNISASVSMNLTAGIKVGVGYSSSAGGTYTEYGLKQYSYFEGYLISRKYIV